MAQSYSAAFQAKMVQRLVGPKAVPADARKLALEPVLAEPLMAVLPAGHRLAERSYVPLAALADEDIVWRVVASWRTKRGREVE
jgi:DNA-binding transcriptional LysR family regulator